MPDSLLHHIFGKVGMQYKGLTFWTPNINIFRDPRWGRGQETYGEDPYLTAVLGKAIVRGLQGSDSVRLKTSACAKHFAVHSGPESSRHTFDAEISDYDLWDTYLPAFRALVTEGKVSSVMGAYNRFRGQPCPTRTPRRQLRTPYGRRPTLSAEPCTPVSLKPSARV